MSFNQLVWNKCREIPKGKVSTYKLLAEAIGHPKAFRAVGGALNKNPHSPIVPCHRVVNSKGHLHGFAHGLTKKKEMLEQEGIEVSKNKINLEKFLYNFK